MRTPSFLADHVRKFLHSKKIATLPELKQAYFSSTSAIGWGLPSPSPIIPPAPPSTTRLNAACSARSAKTGLPNPSPTTTRSSG